MVRAEEKNAKFDADDFIEPSPDHTRLSKTMYGGEGSKPFGGIIKEERSSAAISIADKPKENDWVNSEAPEVYPPTGDENV